MLLTSSGSVKALSRVGVNKFAPGRCVPEAAPGAVLTGPGACGRIRPSMIDPEVLRRAVRAALEEDIGPGDLTSRLVLDEATGARGRIVARERLTVAGISVAEEVFRQVDDSVVFRPECSDGSVRTVGEPCATVQGKARSILAAERTALNFLQRLSGIATATGR